MSLFAISGGLAVDCVRQAHPDFIPKLIDAMADVIEDELVAWISENGGWVSSIFVRIFPSILYSLNSFLKIGLNVHVKPETSEFTMIEWTSMSMAAMLGIVILFYMLKLGCQLIPKLMFS